jgi:hypothetical protein
MGMHRELEITVLSAHNLRNVKLCFGTMNPYAVLWIDSNSKASTHVAERGGTNPSWNCVVRMLCREALFGTAAKAKLVIEVFDYKSMKRAGTADVLLSELEADVVRAGESGEWSEPKRMSFEVRRFRKGSNFVEKVIGSIDIQVRLGRAVSQADDASGGVDRTVTYHGMPIQAHGNDLVPTQEFRTFNTDLPAPIELAQTPGEIARPAYYQHLYVEKPKALIRNIRDKGPPRRLEVAMMACGITLS